MFCGSQVWRWRRGAFGCVMANLWSGKTQGEWCAVSEIRDKSYGDRVVPLVRLNCPPYTNHWAVKPHCSPIPQGESDGTFLALLCWHKRKKLSCLRWCHKLSKAPEMPPDSDMSPFTREMKGPPQERYSGTPMWPRCIINWVHFKTCFFQDPHEEANEV